jgi:hypothetical protein
MSRIHSPGCAIAVLAASFVLAPVGRAAAQAWVPAKGEGAVAIAVQNMNVKQHILTTTWVDVGHIDTFVAVADVTYGLTDRIAVDVALPFVTSRYTGTRPHPTAIDDGKYHSSFADLRFALRYNLTRGGAVITPYIGTIMPSNNYEFFAHAAPGEQLRELQVGAYVAKLFDRGIPGTFISGRFGYGFTEKVLDISHNRSMADLEVGYFFTPSFRAFAMASGQYTHGGIDVPPVGGLAALPPELRPIHDQVDRAHNFKLGGGGAYSITDSIDLFGSFVRTMAGRNEHALNRAITVGTSWSFRRKSNAPDVITGSAPDSLTTARQQQARAESATSATSKRSLLRCICQKSAM